MEDVRSTFHIDLPKRGCETKEASSKLKELLGICFSLEKYVQKKQTSTAIFKVLGLLRVSNQQPVGRQPHEIIDS